MTVGTEAASMTIKTSVFLLFLIRSFFREGAIAKLNIYMALVDAEWYLTAIFESGKELQIAGDS